MTEEQKAINEAFSLISGQLSSYVYDLRQKQHYKTDIVSILLESLSTSIPDRLDNADTIISGDLQRHIDVKEFAEIKSAFLALKELKKAYNAPCDQRKTESLRDLMEATKQTTPRSLVYDNIKLWTEGNYAPEVKVVGAGDAKRSDLPALPSVPVASSSVLTPSPSPAAVEPENVASLRILINLILNDVRAQMVDDNGDPLSMRDEIHNLTQVNGDTLTALHAKMSSIENGLGALRGFNFSQAIHGIKAIQKLIENRERQIRI